MELLACAWLSDLKLAAREDATCASAARVHARACVLLTFALFGTRRVCADNKIGDVGAKDLAAIKGTLEKNQRVLKARHCKALAIQCAFRAFLSRLVFTRLKQDAENESKQHADGVP